MYGRCVFPLMGLAALLTGCTSMRQRIAVTESLLHAERPIYSGFGETAKIPIDGTDTALSVDCMRRRFGERTKRGPASTAPVDECLYVSVRLDSLPVEAHTEPEVRNRVTSALTMLADSNCAAYLFRVFASKSVFDTSRNIFQDLSTGAAAGAAPFSVAAASGLSLANLLIGSTVDNVNSTYYFEKTFQAMESAIAEERIGLLRSMYQRRDDDITKYPLMDALNDVREYADACSLQRGLARLVEMTGEGKKDAEDDLQAVVDPENSAKHQLRELQEGVAKLKEQNLEATLQQQLQGVEKQVLQQRIQELQEEVRRRRAQAPAPPQPPPDPAPTEPPEQQP